MKTRGKEKASVVRVILRMIRARLIISIALTFIFSTFAILGPVSDREKIRFTNVGLQNAAQLAVVGARKAIS